MPRPDRSRARLIETSAVLFRRQGYAATGINQILEGAAVKAGSLYHHFPQGKQELAAAVVEDAGRNIENLLRRALAGDKPVANVVDLWIDLLAAGLAGDERDGCPIEPIATEAVNASPLIRHASARAFASWSAALAERLRADGLSEDAAEQTSLAVVALIEGALLLSRVHGTMNALEATRIGVYAVLDSAPKHVPGTDQ
ncbi:TetR/AcrR family transcriptional regulator [Mycolicibacterium sp. CH28]|uniref:TetR/AcrR family transcriptional regulator n=1 Tax=Mycolicibacterium sp. CH28 TaxID=2512237 RepID=UPI001080240A|nr:TetR/AcrR family transcriptional regulator [Mycolicibacterium sp. CH28]TGD90511.1 TetR/AcrR family transcriptional regulator [Mycolicibacterium sp. CH28]